MSNIDKVTKKMEGNLYLMAQQRLELWKYVQQVRVIKYEEDEEVTEKCLSIRKYKENRGRWSHTVVAPKVGADPHVVRRAIKGVSSKAN